MEHKQSCSINLSALFVLGESKHCLLKQMTDAGPKISIIYTSVPDFFLRISYHVWVYDQQSNFVSVQDIRMYPGSMGMRLKVPV